jgi:hypothetical protein
VKITAQLYDAMPAHLQRLFVKQPNPARAEVVALFPDVGISSGGRIGNAGGGAVENVPTGNFSAGNPGYGDSGSAARFFYCAKASAEDRNEGLAAFEPRPSYMVENGSKTSSANGVRYDRTTSNRNVHPTVKPTELMRYLVRMVTPPSGVVLDPFMGSGSTGKAAELEDVRFIGIERDASYYAIAKARIAHAQAQPKQQALELPSAAADVPTNPADQMGFAWE